MPAKSVDIMSKCVSKCEQIRYQGTHDENVNTRVQNNQSCLSPLL